MRLSHAMRRNSKDAAARLVQGLSSSPLAKLLPRLDAGRKDVLRVLTYHRVDWPDARPDLCASTLSTTPIEFEQQMRCLREHFHVVDVKQVLHAFRSGEALPAGAVLITFDDASRDFAEHAWPVLKRFDLPATMFVPTAFPGQPNRVFWWDRVAQIGHYLRNREGIETSFGRWHRDSSQSLRDWSKAVGSQLTSLHHAEMRDELDRIAAEIGIDPPPAVLDWDELRKLADEGLSLAPHTRTHPLLNRIPDVEARAEVQASRNDLRQHVGEDLPVFAYPGGAYDAKHVQILREEGIELAFTTCRGANDIRHCDSLRLRRINMGRKTSPELLNAQLYLPPSLFNRLASLPA